LTQYQGSKGHGATSDVSPVKAHAKKCVLARKGTEDGPLEVIMPEESLRYQYYVANFLMYGVESQMAKKFCLRFRIPFPSYLELVKQIKADDRFDPWCGFKQFKKTTSLIELLVLGSLRYLGRGWTFDDIEENTAISQEVHRTFFVFSSTLEASFYMTSLCRLLCIWMRPSQT
jgi:hypothetical protein